MTAAALHGRGKVMIEAGLNESVQRSARVAVPVTVSQVIDDVAGCAHAGAAVSHYHARDADDADMWSDVDFYREVMAAPELRADTVTGVTHRLPRRTGRGGRRDHRRAIGIR